ncbi:MAG: Fic family protein [Candidatus Saccharimonadales bacterium]
MNYLQQLQSILKASEWSQEQLAQKLGVSFATVNAWLRERSEPRNNALLNIERLYLDTIGVEVVAPAQLATTKTAALQHKLSVTDITRNRPVLDALTLYLTYHTNTIEGSTMTLSDVEDVIFSHKVLSNRTVIEQTEARNHQAALNWVLDCLQADSKLLIDEAFMLGIHLRLMNGIVSDAGQYRKHGVRIMGSRTAVANWLKVPELMAELAIDMNTDDDDVLSLLAKTHADFEKIHPFSDGNGRTGRLLLLAMALRANLTPPIVVKERKYAYYKYLEIAQTKQVYAPLELFVAESVIAAADILNSVAS